MYYVNIVVCSLWREGPSGYRSSASVREYAVFAEKSAGGGNAGAKTGMRGRPNPLQERLSPYFLFHSFHGKVFQFMDAYEVEEPCRTEAENERYPEAQHSQGL